MSSSVDLVVALEGHAAPCDERSGADQAFLNSCDQSLQLGTENSGDEISSDVGSSASMVSGSTLPCDGRSLKRGMSASKDFNTDAVPESAKPAFLKLFEVADAAHEQAENLRAAVEAVRNALTTGLVSFYLYRLSWFFSECVANMPVSRSDPEYPNSCSWALNATPTSYLLLLICLSAEAIQSIRIAALGPSTPRQHLTCCMTEIVRTRREVVPLSVFVRKSYEHGERSFRFLLFALNTVLYICVGLCSPLLMTKL